jgi:hypothetical protein
MKHLIKKSEFYDAYVDRKDYIEVFKNPTSKEADEVWNKSDAIRAFLHPNGDMYCWDGEVLHGEVERQFPNIASDYRISAYESDFMLMYLTSKVTSIKQIQDVLKNCDMSKLKISNNAQIEFDTDYYDCVMDLEYVMRIQDKKISDKKDGLIVQLRSFKGIKKEFLADLAFAISKYYKGKISVFSFQDEIDEKNCLEFVEELKKQDVVAEYISNKSIEDTIEILNNVKFVISTRLHGLIISSALQSKTFALSYDQKVKTLANEIDIENIDIYNYSQKELDEKLCKFFKDENKKYSYRYFDWEFLKKAVD